MELGIKVENFKRAKTQMLIAEHEMVTMCNSLKVKIDFDPITMDDEIIKQTISSKNI